MELTKCRNLTPKNASNMLKGLFHSLDAFIHEEMLRTFLIYIREIRVKVVKGCKHHGQNYFWIFIKKKKKSVKSAKN